MNVFCYFDNPKAPNYPDRLIECWRESWEANGFTPRVMTEADARANPRFTEIEATCKALPTVNDRRFEMSCWLRWLAFQQVAPGVFTDYDVINFSLRPEDVPTGNVVCLESPASPCCIYATREGLAGFLDAFKLGNQCATLIDGRQHTSDLMVFQAWHKGPPIALSKLVTHAGHLHSQCVHFPNGLVKNKWLYEHRWKAVEAHRIERATNYACPQERIAPEGMVAIVLTHAEAKETTERHMSFWRNHGFPIWMISPTDHPLALPGDHQTFHLGLDSYAGARKAQKIVAILKMFCASQYAHAVWFEYDSICLHQTISPASGLWGCLAQNTEPLRFISPRYAVPPLVFDRASAKAMLAAHARYPEILEGGFDDRFLSGLAHISGVPISGNLPGTYAQNTITKRDYEPLRDAIIKHDAAWIHGLKDKDSLDVALDAWKERCERK